MPEVVKDNTATNEAETINALSKEGALENTAENAALADEGTSTEAASETGDAAAPQESKKVAWWQKRINTLTARAKEAERETSRVKSINETLLSEFGTRTNGEAAAPNATPPAGPGKTLSQPEIDKLVTERAGLLRTVERFNETCNEVYDKGSSEFKDFQPQMENLHAVGALNVDENPAFINTVVELSEPHKVLYYLGKNPEEVQKIMAMPPAKMAIELARLEDKLSKTSKSISSAPNPLQPVRANTQPTFDPEAENADMDEWIAWREKTRKTRQ